MVEVSYNNLFHHHSIHDYDHDDCNDHDDHNDCDGHGYHSDYDDSYYNIGMIYYKEGDLDKAQKAFYSLRAEDPDSMYNNSKVESILKER